MGGKERIYLVLGTVVEKESIVTYKMKNLHNLLMSCV